MRRALFIFIVIVMGIYVGNHPNYMNMGGLSIVSILLFAYPAFASVVRRYKVLGMRVLIVLSLFALGIETLALRTGFPYGAFTYTGHVGYKLLGITPLIVPFSWVPLIVGSYSLGTILTRKYAIPISVGILVLCDVVLDPGAVALGVWQYAHAEGIYHVPWSNFWGWILSGTIGMGLLTSFLPRKPQLTDEGLLSMQLILSFWVGVALSQKLWFSVAVYIVLATLWLHSLKSKNT